MNPPSPHFLNEVLHMLLYELREPFRAVMRGLHTMQSGLGSGSVDPNLAEANAVTLQTSERLLSVIDGLLDILRDSTLRLTLVPVAPHKLAALILQAVRDSLGERPIPVQIENTVPPDLEDVVLDKHLMTQALSDLVRFLISQSAISGTIRLAAERDAHWLILRLIDLREGHPPDHLEALQHVLDASFLPEQGPIQHPRLFLPRLAILAHGGSMRSERREGAPSAGLIVSCRLPVGLPAGSVHFDVPGYSPHIS